MTETGNEPTAVDVELVSVEDLESMEVIAKVGDKTSEINFLAKADSALQIISDVLETIPEKGLFKVEVPEGFTLQDLAPVKGEEGAFRGIVRSSEKKIAGQAKLTEAGRINPTQIAGVGLAAAAMVIGQAYMTEISDSLHDINEKLDRVVSMIADEQRARLMNALDIAKTYSKLYDDYRQKPDAMRAARNEIERCYNDVGTVIDWITLQLSPLDERAREAKASKKELQPLIEELHSYEDQFNMSLKALSALAMTRMYYDGSTDERSSLIEQKRIMEKARGFLKRRASVAGVLEIRIGSMKGAPVALPRGVGKNPLRNLTSMTPRAAAKQNLLDAKIEMQSNLRASQSRSKKEAQTCADGIKQIAAVSRASRTILTDGNNCWIAKNTDRMQGNEAQ